MMTAWRLAKAYFRSSKSCERSTRLDIAAFMTSRFSRRTCGVPTMTSPFASAAPSSMDVARCAGVSDVQKHDVSDYVIVRGGSTGCTISRPAQRRSALLEEGSTDWETQTSICPSPITGVTVTRGEGLNLALINIVHINYPRTDGFDPTPKNAPPGCTAGCFCLGIEALRRYAAAGGALSFPVDRGELASRRTDARCARRACRGVHTADGSEG